MGIEINQQQVTGWVKAALIAGSPIYDFSLKKLGISEGDYQIYTSLAVYILPPIIVAVWTWYGQRRSSQVANVASFTPAEQAEALAKTPDAAKILIAEAVPTVATVVVKNDAGNGVGKLAASDDHPNIVTESKNQIDAISGIASSKP
jgi:hypothetical protein